MAFTNWNYNEYFKHLPSTKRIAAKGRRSWDINEEHANRTNSSDYNDKKVFIMPSFGRHGRWGNMVFQYIFIRILAHNNSREIELYREGDRINDSMNLYDDMKNIPGIKNKASTILLDNYHLFSYNSLSYVPDYIWRAMYLSGTARKKCYILKETEGAINNPVNLSDEAAVEVEGLFLLNPLMYKQNYKDFILSKLFNPTADFGRYVDDCIKKMGENKTIIGIHIRRGDFVTKPLNQFFQLPIPARYIKEWLATKISTLTNPVLFICSDDPDAYKDFEGGGLDVFYLKKLLAEQEVIFRQELVDWEILRHCNVLLTSNSSFSFSAAFLNLKQATCYQFLFAEKEFKLFNPWDCEPLQSCVSSPNFWSYLYRRFLLVSNFVSTKSACKRVLKDLINWKNWKKSKAAHLYYFHGFSTTFFYKLFNMAELFQLSDKPTQLSGHDGLLK